MKLDLAYVDPEWERKVYEYVTRCRLIGVTTTTLPGHE